MKGELVPLNLLPIGNFGIVKHIISKGSNRRRLMDLGLITDTTVVSLRKSPSGDPIAYEIRGTVIALRSEEASNILVKIINSEGGNLL
ncbi:MAG: ferrous iron transport protein A [Clostridiales bacterium]|nr:ferrous iron transport protein A [Clostridiales bacterium]